MGLSEDHAREQYFFAPETIAALLERTAPYERVCCLCCPTLGVALAEAGRPAAAVLDIDERFAAVPGFVHWDLTRPRWLGDRFDLIVADPPFFAVSLGQLAAAVKVLAHHDPAQPLLVSYLVRRERRLLSAFTDFGLAPAGLEAQYTTVDPVERNRIAFYGNRTGPPDP